MPIVPFPDRTGQAAVAPKLLRRMNQHLILEVLYRRGVMTKPMLAQEIGLSQPTVNAACDELMTAGLVIDAGREQQSTGRPAQQLRANARAGAVLGIDVGRRWVRVTAADLMGETLDSHAARNRTRSAKALVELIVQCVEVVTARADIHGPVQYVLGSPGVYDEEHDRVLLADQLPGWHRPKLPTILREALGPNLAIDNDVNLAAMGELDAGAARAVRTFGYVHIGTGLGFASVVEGRLVRGAHGSAGEIAYLPVGGSGATLEEHLSAPGLVRAAQNHGLGDLAPEDVVEAVLAGRGAGAVIREQLVEQVASLLINIYALLDPALVVFGGGIGHELRPLIPQFVQRVSDRSPFLASCTVSELKDSATMRGAIVHGLPAARELVFQHRLSD